MTVGRERTAVALDTRAAQLEAVTAAAVALVSNPAIWDAVLLLTAVLDADGPSERYEAVEALQVSASAEADAGRLTAQLDTLDSAGRAWALFNAGGSLLNLE